MKVNDTQHTVTVVLLGNELCKTPFLHSFGPLNSRTERIKDFLK